MSAQVQIELIKVIIRDWTRSDDCSGVDAICAINEILDFDPYTWEPETATATSATGGE